MNYSVDVHDNCVTAYDQKDFKGRAWAFCADDCINERHLVGEPIETCTTWSDSHRAWADRISSIRIGKLEAKLFREAVRPEIHYRKLRMQCDGKSLNTTKSRNSGPYFDNKVECLVFF